jgi:tetratricopeptide (TPR) repeat protein
MANLYKAMKMFVSLKSDSELVNIYYDIGTAYQNLGQVDSTVSYLRKSIDLAERIGSPYEKRESLFTLYEFYRKSNEYSKALSYYTKYTQLRDSISNYKIKQSFQELEIKYQTAQRELDIQKLKDQQIIDQSRKRVLVILFFAVVLFAVMGIVFLIMKRRKDQEIHKQKLIVLQKEKDLNQAELAEKEAAEKQIKKELEFKNKQLASHALIMMQKNTFYKELAENIHSHMQLIDGKGKLVLLQIQKKLEQSFNIEKDWDLFQLYFVQTNENFFENLKKINPKLTSNDYRLAALINLNLNIKETASVLNISPDSLKNARYRLKQKLNIPKTISLPEFLRTM